MLSDLECPNKVVGLKQTIRAIDEGKVSKVFLAKDVSSDIYNKISVKCQKNGIEIEYVERMKDMGDVCKIDVPAAVAAILC